MAAPRRTRVLIALAWAVIVLQAASFFVLDRHLPPRSQALYHYAGTDDIIEISLREDPNPMSRYSIWVALAEIAPRSTLYDVSRGSRTTTHRAYAFGGVDRVVWVDQARRVYPHDDFLDFVVASGPGAHKGPPWMIALDPANGTGGDPDDPAGFLPRALEGGNRGSDPGPAREFVLLWWRGQPVDDAAAEYFNHHHVLMEVSLLSDDLKEQYGLEEAG